MGQSCGGIDRVRQILAEQDETDRRIALSNTMHLVNNTVMTQADEIFTAAEVAARGSRAGTPGDINVAQSMQIPASIKN